MKQNINEDIFIKTYIETGNATLSVVTAGYIGNQPDRYVEENLLRKERVRKEIARLKDKMADGVMVAKATEILQFYTSVMRGEVLDQFGLEASLDTRLKAANELSKHLIELPAKLEAKGANNNNSGTINLNIIPRNDVIEIEKE